MSKIVDGKALALKQEEALREKVKSLGVTPKIISILVGDDPASVLYSNIKKNKATDVGINFELREYPVTTSVGDLVSDIKEFNNNLTVNGIMIQLPLPEEFLKGITEDTVVQTITPEKDVDGLTGKGKVLHATVKAVISIFEEEGVDVKGKKVAVVGATGMVGTPMVKVCKEMGAEILEIDSNTDNWKTLTKDADILISCVGKQNLITPEGVKDGAVVIDVGMDVDFERVKEKASVITPPKGGVGPMTVISLMENVVELLER